MSKKAQFTSKLGNLSPTYLAETREYFAQLEYLQPIQYSNVSRYKNIRTLKDYDNSRIHHESWKLKGIQKSNSDESYYTITLETENRLDLIAYEYYGSARYWWVIAMANDIIDPFTVSVGTRLRIPPLLSLYKTGGVLNG